ncbi:MAG TPA: PilT/PilU family type 4a pilus ATPase, partial [Bdellovibrionales bacterium]|nr:PilT/PilU family type 4a pilus ATPase [Bdellovibrionales bacterium]
PVIRVNGNLRPLSPKAPVFDATSLKNIATSMMSSRQRAQFEKSKEIDMSYGVAGLGRFRVNVFQQRGTVRIVIRHLAQEVPQLDELGLPPVLKKFADYERGLVLVTGVTGSGKSTTLAALIDHINRNKSKHILTIEDPIEYVIRDRKSLITQRELGSDTDSFPAALRAALRQDPDVILIGEMRDIDTINIALLAAETGHLVFSTLHTGDASETINRILAAYPAMQQTQVRLQLASSLKAVVSQRLARRVGGKGRVAAVEVMINTPRTQEMIVDPAKTKLLTQAIEEGVEHYEMQSYDQSLMKLLSEKVIDYNEALKLSTNPENFALRLKGITSQGGHKWNNFDLNTSVTGVMSAEQNTVTGTKIELELFTQNEKEDPSRRKK